MPTTGNTAGVDSISALSSPVAARLAIYTHIAASKLNNGEITLDQAKLCRDRERVLRADLEDAIKRNDATAINAVSARIDRYMQELTGDQ